MLALVITLLCLVRCLVELLSRTDVGDLALLESNKGGQNVEGNTQRRWHDIPQRQL